MIVISHDRHFLNKVCTHIADVDYKQINIYTGNYDFWEKTSQLAFQQKRDTQKKQLDKIKELEDFVRRFSANASKSKQATSRKKLIEKLRPEDIQASSRRSPFIQFKPNRPTGDNVLTVKNLSHSIEGNILLNDVTFKLEKKDKLAIIGKNALSKTTLLELLSGKIAPESGSITWGSTTSQELFPKDNAPFFENEFNLFDWLNQYMEKSDDQVIRGLLGRMLFSGDEVFKSTSVLSGGEKARAMFSKMMLSEANALLFDEPTDHLDLESISSLNEGLIKFPEIICVTSHDFQLLNTVTNKVLEVGPKGMIFVECSFESYIQNESLKAKRKALY